MWQETGSVRMTKTAKNLPKNLLFTLTVLQSQHCLVLLLVQLSVRNSVQRKHGRIECSVAVKQVWTVGPPSSERLSMNLHIKGAPQPAAQQLLVD